MVRTAGFILVVGISCPECFWGSAGTLQGSVCLSEESLHEKSHRRTLPRVIPGTSPPFFIAVVIVALTSADKVLFSH